MSEDDKMLCIKALEIMRNNRIINRDTYLSLLDTVKYSNMRLDVPSYKRMNA